MQQLSLVLEGHPILNTTCEPWTGQEDAEQLVRDMTRVMIATNGLGLSAPQVGKNYRMFVMGNSERLYACFNPQILMAGPEEKIQREGCLSFPGLWLSIKRPTWIIAAYQDVKGAMQQHRFEGIVAQCFQHELDHLDGICFTERAAKLSLKTARERQQKWLRKKI